MVTVINTLKWPSKASLMEHLRGGKALLLGEAAEAPRLFCSFETSSGAVGVISSGLHDVSVIKFNGDRSILVGSDFSLTWIDVSSLTVSHSGDVDGVFYEFITTDSDDEMIAIHELGAMRVTANGTVVWKIDADDIVTGHRLDGAGNLTLLVADGSQVVVPSGHRDRA